jgi:hypothetical protein
VRAVLPRIVVVRRVLAQDLLQIPVDRLRCYSPRLTSVGGGRGYLILSHSRVGLTRSAFDLYIADGIASRMRQSPRQYAPRTHELIPSATAVLALACALPRTPVTEIPEALTPQTPRAAESSGRHRNR